MNVDVVEWLEESLDLPQGSQMLRISQNRIREKTFLKECHTLRPTLSHPDLTSLLAVGANKGITLDLAGDNDGKPVNILDIHGSIETHRASKLEELLWTLIP